MQFGILGPLEASRDGVPVQLGGVKQRTLLAVLVLNAGEVVATDRLVDELWGEEPPPTAVKTVQVFVSQLRKALGRDVIETRSPGYVLQVDPEAIDLGRFQRLAAEGRRRLAAGNAEGAAAKLREALRLWRGQPLADLAYERFAQAEVARLQELREAALEDRIEAELQSGAAAELVPELEALAARSPLRERLRGQLMLALYRSGRQGDALEAYRQARAALVEELGIEPGRELRDLQQAILEQDPRLAAPEAAAAPPAESLFVGRERELGELRAGLDRAIAGRGSVFLVGGEPGIGKSRLADELARHAHDRDLQVLWGRCWEGKGAPAYWPWVQPLRSYLRTCRPEQLRPRLGLGAAQLAELLPELRELYPDIPRPAVRDPEAARFQLFDAVAGMLRGAAELRPIALILDDVHAADEPSLVLLRFIAAQLGDARLTVLAAYRDTETGPGHPLAGVLADLTREPVAHRIHLRGLAPSEVGRFIELTGGEAAPERLVAEIHARTEGNPLFVTETVRLLESEGKLAGGSAWGALGMPTELREVIGRRLDALPRGARGMLAVASVLGREFEIETFERVIESPSRDALTALDAAIAARLVQSAAGTPGRLRFSHALVRDALYESLPAGRRVNLHRRIGEALAARYAEDPGPHLAELAYHFYEGASRSGALRAADYAERAARHAAGQLAYEEAARLCRLALDALELAGARDPHRSCELLLARGDAQARAGEDPAAKETFLQAAALARREGMHEQLARAALGYGGRWVWTVGRGDPHLLPLLEEAERMLPKADSCVRVRLLARLAGGPLKGDENRERRHALSSEAVEMARRLADPSAVAYALDGRTAAVLGPDTAEEQWTTQAEVRRLAEQADDLERLVQSHIYRLFELMARLRLDEFDAEYALAKRRAEELRQPAQRWMVGSIAAMHALLVGRLPAAEALIEQAHRLGRDAVGWNADVSRRLQTFVLRGLQGRLAEVEADVCAAVKTYATYPVWRAVLVSLYASLKRQAEARAALDDVAADEFAVFPRDEEWLLAMTLLSDGCWFLRDAETAALLYERLAPYADRNVMAESELALGSTGRALGKLAAAMGRMDAAARHFRHAAEVNLRAGAIPWAALALHDHAGALLAADGDAGDAAAELLMSKANDLFHEVGVPPPRPQSTSAVTAAGAGRTNTRAPTS